MEYFLCTSSNLVFSLISTEDTPLICFYRIGSFIIVNHILGNNIYRTIDLLTNSFLGTYLFAILTFQANDKTYDKELVMRNSVGIAMVYTTLQLNTRYNVFGVLCKLFSIYLLLGFKRHPQQIPS